MADALWTREYAALPGVALKRVDDARHFIMIDQPERLDDLIDVFLKGEDGSRIRRRAPSAAGRR
ncbi:hypothetical protein [Brevundimonas sp.]|uniref:hypothetical protein n=1 Tax=Brevundimonas sp. TaxID=1871086 RepID=UPI0028A153EF|nr:hypothetical protein [Brevundimonas sp.]